MLIKVHFSIKLVAIIVKKCAFYQIINVSNIKHLRSIYFFRARSSPSVICRKSLQNLLFRKKRLRVWDKSPKTTPPLSGQFITYLVDKLFFIMRFPNRFDMFKYANWCNKNNKFFSKGMTYIFGSKECRIPK